MYSNLWYLWFSQLHYTIRYCFCLERLLSFSKQCNKSIVPTNNSITYSYVAISVMTYTTGSRHSWMSHHRLTVVATVTEEYHILSFIFCEKLLPYSKDRIINFIIFMLKWKFYYFFYFLFFIFFCAFKDHVVEFLC